MKLFWFATTLTVIGIAGLLIAVFLPLEGVRGTVIDSTGVHPNTLTYIEPFIFLPLMAISGTLLVTGLANLVIWLFVKETNRQ